MKLPENGGIFRYAGKIDQRCANSPQHVQACAQRVLGVVAQTVDARGRSHVGGHGVVLLEEGDELRDAARLAGDASADERVGRRQIGQEDDGKLARDLIFAIREHFRQYGEKSINAAKRRRGEE